MSTYKNLGLLFNKHYFNDITWNDGQYNSISNQDDLKGKNEVLFASELEAGCIPELDKNIHSFKVKTIYPGLFSGSGYAHESTIEGELKLGFFFDYTSGLPCIPGSSVKGVLRHVCAMDNGKYVKWIIEELASGTRKSKIKEEAGKLNADVFLFPDTGKTNKNNEPIHKESEFIKTVFEAPEDTSIYNRDIFFDAFPIGQGEKFLGSDFITPHKDPLKNPLPLQFMKVMPGVEFEFRFKLVASNGLSIELKKELFRQILLDLGIGAKTNVGYGQFEEFIDNRKKLEDIKVGDEIECKIKEAIYRENDNKYQLYLSPEIIDYEALLKSLDKPFPSIRIDKYSYNDIREKNVLVCKVKRIVSDTRVLLEDSIISAK